MQYASYAAQSNFTHPVGNWQNKKDHPVVSVSWDDALNYCEWYNREYAGQLPVGLHVSLPSEAEWEMAAHGTDGRRHPWGEAAPVRGLCNIDQWYQGITPVGQFSPGGDSPFGCADMAGNVWEWTRSLFKRYPYNPQDGREDLEVVGRRVLRGGSWHSSGRDALCTSRLMSNSSSRLSYYGFRLVLRQSLPAKR